MPYKDKEKLKSYQKGWVRQKRGNRGSQGEGSTFFIDGIEYVPASYVEGLNGMMYQSLPERPRYLTLSDGQVLDRLNQPRADIGSGNRIQAIRASNEAMYNYRPNRGSLSGSLRAKMVSFSP